MSAKAYSLDLGPEISELACEFASGMTDVGQLTHLAGMLAAMPESEEAVIVEIGTYEGATAAFLAKLLLHFGRRGKVLSIDPFDRCQPDELNPQGVYERYREQVRKHGVEEICLPLVAFSQEAAAVVPECLGMLIVDGSHRYEVVHEDLVSYMPKVLSGGFVFIDDYCDPYPDVVRASDEFFEANPSFEICHRSYFVTARRL